MIIDKQSISECVPTIYAPENTRVAIISKDFTNESASCLIQNLTHSRAVVAPLLEVNRKFFDIAQIEYVIDLNKKTNYAYPLIDKKENEILNTLSKTKTPGLILFSSGSSGEPKASVHDFNKLLKRYSKKRPPKTLAAFLMFDHIGGINTLLHTYFTNGKLVCLGSRDPEHVCQMIEKHKVQILPTTPTFLKLLLLSKSYMRHNMTSLEVITYGTEFMPEGILQQLHKEFPWVYLKQTYGLSEVGILPTKSKASNSTWMKAGGSGYQTRIRDNLLEIKTDMAMLGYLNAPSPFTEDGWFKTGDRIERDGEWIKILGRDSDIINVGGQKVYPIEIENHLMSMNNVIDATVSSHNIAIMGSILKADIILEEKEDRYAFLGRMKEYLKDKVPKWAIPIKVHIQDKKEIEHSVRYKKIR